MRYVLCSFLLVNCYLAAQPEAALIRQMDDQLTQRGLSSSERAKLLAQREDALFSLMKSGPNQATGFFAKSSLTHFEGAAHARVEDYFDSGKSILKWQIRTSTGTVREVFFASDPPELKCETSAIVDGYELRGRVVAIIAAVTAAAVSGCSTTGPQKVAVLMLQFPSQSLPGNITKPMLTSAFFGATRSLDAYWREASYGQTSATGEVFGPFTLNQDYTCDQSDDIFAAAINAASATVDFTIYNRVFMIVPQRGTCAIGLGEIGCAVFNSSRGPVLLSPVWLRADYLANADFTLAVAAHEGGHNLGLNHSGSLDYGLVPLGMFKGGSFTEYGDYFSVMSALFGNGLVAHYSAPHKSLLGWFGSSNVQQVESNGTFTILPYETPQSGLQAIKVRRGAGNDSWLWVEYRQPTGFDSGLSTYSTTIFPGSALIHYDDPGYSTLFTRSLDFNPTSASGNDFASAPLQPGSSWKDPYSLLNLSVNSATSAGLSVSASYDTACASLSATSIAAPVAGKTGSIAVTAPGTCSWAAASSDTWLSLTGTTSGTGNGTVNYSIAANATAQSRTAFLVIQRQAITTTQPASANAPPVVNSVAVTANTYTFTYTDDNGASDVQWVAGRLSNAGGNCLVQADVIQRKLTLVADDGATVLGPLNLSSTSTLENSFCKVYPSLSSILGDQNSVTFGLGLDLKPPSGGQVTVSGAVADLTGAGGAFRALASVTSACSYSLSSSGAIVPQSGGTGSVNVITAASCPWTAISNQPWLTITSGASGTGNGTVNYLADSNPGVGRTGALTIGGQMFTVNQQNFVVLPNYAGYIDRLDCQAVSGWAADRSRLNQAIMVSIYDGNTLLGTVTANQLRSDVGLYLGDNGLHGFSFPIPAGIRDGQSHLFRVIYEDSPTELPGSSKTFTCLTAPVSYAGWVDSASCSGITGWAADLNRKGQSIQVSLWYNGAAIATATANGSRPDVGAAIGDNGVHGFRIDLPANYRDGVSRTYSVKFEDSNTNLTLGAAIPLSCSSTALYSGWLDSTSCSTISGWAADRSRANAAISVDLVVGSTVIETILATLNRPDVGAVIGDNGAHGFSFATPSSLKDGSLRTIDLRYSGTAQSLGNSPKTLQCSAGPAASYAGWVDSVSCSAISGWAADKNLLNTSIGVEIYDGSTLVGTASATTLRSDVGAYLGDNGLHGYSWPTPASLKDGHTHTIAVRPAGSSVTLSGAQTLSCTP